MKSASLLMQKRARSPASRSGVSVEITPFPVPDDLGRRIRLFIFLSCFLNTAPLFLWYISPHCRVSSMAWRVKSTFGVFTRGTCPDIQMTFRTMRFFSSMANISGGFLGFGHCAEFVMDGNSLASFHLSWKSNQGGLNGRQCLGEQQSLGREVNDNLRIVRTLLFSPRCFWNVPQSF